MFYQIGLLKLFQNFLSLSIFAAFAIILIGQNSAAQTSNTAPEQRWTGLWADSSTGQTGNLDIMINNSNGNMSGSITNGVMKGTWTGNIYRNGVIKANYQYAGQPYNYLAQGMCQMNSSGQLIARMEFIYQNQKIGEGTFALAPANAMSAASPTPQGNSGLAKALESKPVGNPDLLKNGNPNVNDYRDNYKGYIDQLVPGFSELVKGETEAIHNYGNPTQPRSDQNAVNGPSNPGAGNQPSSFLLQAWIVPYNEYGVTTYDFTQLEAYGQSTVSIRGWQKIGTLGWQSNQNYTFVSFKYNEAANQVTMTSATGYQNQWNIIKVENTRMLVESKGQQFYAYNCSDTGWPDAIKAAMRGCRQQ